MNEAAERHRCISASQEAAALVQLGYDVHVVIDHPRAAKYVRPFLLYGLRRVGESPEVSGDRIMCGMRDVYIQVNHQFRIVGGDNEVSIVDMRQDKSSPIVCRVGDDALVVGQGIRPPLPRTFYPVSEAIEALT